MTQDRTLQDQVTMESRCSVPALHSEIIMTEAEPLWCTVPNTHISQNVHITDALKTTRMVRKTDRDTVVLVRQAFRSNSAAASGC